MAVQCDLSIKRLLRFITIDEIWVYCYTPQNYKIVQTMDKQRFSAIKEVTWNYFGRIFTKGKNNKWRVLC